MGRELQSSQAISRSSSGRVFFTLPRGKAGRNAGGGKVANDRHLIWVELLVRHEGTRANFIRLIYFNFGQ
ncbi:MAG: hypothetical protein AAB468_02815 [Patescibacteria group bacterium]